LSIELVHEGAALPETGTLALGVRTLRRESLYPAELSGLGGQIMRWKAQAGRGVAHSGGDVVWVSDLAKSEITTKGKGPSSRSASG
jgi:hypothetical protein